MKRSNTVLRDGIILGFIILFLNIPCVFAQRGSWGKGEKAQSEKEDLMKQLNLTQEQQTQLNKYREENRAKRQTTMNALKEYRTQMREELDKENSDPKKIEELKSRIKSAQGEIVDNQVESVTNVKSVLTPAQFQELQTKAQEHRQMRMEERKKSWNKGGEGHEL